MTTRVRAMGFPKVDFVIHPLPVGHRYVITYELPVMAAETVKGLKTWTVSLVAQAALDCADALDVHEEFLDRNTMKLTWSPGTDQNIHVTVEFLGNPEMLVADEPTTLPWDGWPVGEPPEGDGEPT